MKRLTLLQMWRAIMADFVIFYFHKGAQDRMDSAELTKPASYPKVLERALQFADIGARRV